MFKEIILTLLLICTANLFAQRTNSSPYSFFGIGEEYNLTTVEQSAMGDIGVAFSHYKYLNFLNPASFADLRFTTYTAGMLNNRLTIKNNTTEQSSNITSLSYIALGFPIGKKAGFSFGMQPISSVGYSINKSEEDENTLFTGSGGLNRLYGSLGIKIFKNFSLGIETNFIFGEINNSILNQKEDVTLATKYDEESTVKGGAVTFGIQYQKELKNKLILNSGVTYKLSSDLNLTGTSIIYSVLIINNNINNIRKVLKNENGEDQTNTEGKYKFPGKIAFGLGLGKLNKWYAGVEYETRNAIITTSSANLPSVAYKYGSTNRLYLGGFFIPKINSISNYFHRVTYRAGIRFKKIGLLVDSSGEGLNFTPINDFSVSFGLGLPLKQLSTFNMGFEFGKKGSITNGLIQENYFNLRLSLSLTSINWFQKRKID